MVSDSVALVRYCGGMEKTLEKAIKFLGGFGKLSSPILIKPNICAGEDITGVANTNVGIVEALVKLIVNEQSDLSVRIIESDSESKFVDEAFEKFGYKSLEKEWRDLGFDVSLINLSRTPLKELSLDGQYFKNPKLPSVLTEYGYYISVAVAKTHSLTLVTGALKNQFGLLPRKDQSFYHTAINDVIVDMNRLVKPNLCIIDAVKGLEGVISGRPRMVNMVIVGKKPASVDASMARLIGFNPHEIRHIVEACNYDLGTLDPEILGEDLDSATVKFRTPSNLDPNALVKLS